MSYTERYGRQTVAIRSNGVCERCDAGRATDWSHRKARGQQGSWEPANGLGLCRGCHAWAHAHPKAAIVLGIFISAHDMRPPEEIPVVTRHGRVYLLNSGAIIAAEPTLTDLPFDIRHALEEITPPWSNR
ncbi:HNH endonuclease [Gordonia phage Aleemily]|uniref:HNH endonuclease n=1 Tax=Gordonia phage Aleemily TaxID=2965181 RepID=A0A9E7TXK8_9CAUD|nr:HNH endonuclease [Gordonia phage Aleemily]